MDGVDSLDTPPFLVGNCTCTDHFLVRDSGTSGNQLNLFILHYSLVAFGHVRCVKLKYPRIFGITSTVTINTHHVSRNDSP
jgi:hypothetical protein